MGKNNWNHTLTQNFAKLESTPYELRRSCTIQTIDLQLPVNGLTNIKKLHYEI